MGVHASWQEAYGPKMPAGLWSDVTRCAGPQGVGYCRYVTAQSPGPGMQQILSTATTSQTIHFPSPPLLLVFAIKPKTTQTLHRQSPVHIMAKFMVPELFPSSGLGKK